MTQNANLHPPEAGDSTFAVRFPVLVSLDDPIDWPGASNRLRNVLSREGSPSWSDIATLTPLELVGAGGWRAFGQKTLTELLERGAVLSSEIEPSDTDAEMTGSVARALVQLGTWGRSEQGAATIGEALGLAANLPADEIPEEITAAADTILGLSTAPLTSPNAAEYSLKEGVQHLLAELDPRGMGILLARQLQPDKKQRRKLEPLGADMGLTRERVRQLGKKAEAQLLASIKKPHGAVVRRAAARLRRELGIVQPTGSAESLLRSFGPVQGLPEELRPIALKVLLWIAGPYLIADDWLVRQDIGALVGRTCDVLDGLLAAGDVPWSRAVDATFGLGFVDTCVVEEWLESLSGYRNLDGQLVRWDSGLAEKAAVVLAARREAMSRQDLLDVIGYGSVGSLGNLLAQDDRFVRVDRDAFELVEWGGDEYLGIVGLIGREVDRAGGALPLEVVVAELTQRYTVAEASVYSYASSHPDFVVSDGVVRRRGPDEAIAYSGDVRSDARCYRRNGGWSWRRRVDHDVLRGSGMNIPAGFAIEAGARPGEVHVRSSECGDVRFLWTSMQPTIGSLRVPALELGAEIGDWLFVGLDGPSGVRFELLKAAALESEDSRHERFRLMTGIDPQEYRSDELRAIGKALGSDDPLPSFRSAATLLRSRGEDGLADLLPDDDGADAVTDVLRQLGFES